MRVSATRRTGVTPMFLSLLFAAVCIAAPAVSVAQAGNTQTLDPTNPDRKSTRLNSSHLA